MPDMAVLSITDYNEPSSYCWFAQIVTFLHLKNGTLIICASER